MVISTDVHGGNNATLDHFDTDDCCINKNIVSLALKVRFFANFTFAPSALKRSSTVAVEKDRKTFRFNPQLSFLFALQHRAMEM